LKVRSSGSNIQALNDAGLDAYVATDRQEKPNEKPLELSDRKFVKADFIYHPEGDYFVCPAQEKLETNPDSKAKRKSYQASKNTCEGCVFLPRCNASKTKNSGRIIQTDEHERVRQAMNKKMATPQAKEVYDRRKVIVEPVFGQIKNSGFRNFGLRGKDKVAGEFSLICAAHNFKKIVNAKLTGLVRLKNGKEQKIAA